MHGRDLTPLLNNPEDKSWKSPLLLAHTGMSFGEDCDEVIDIEMIPSIKSKRFHGGYFFVLTGTNIFAICYR